MEEKDITKREILESVNRGFSAMEQKIDGVALDLQSFKIDVATRFNNLESDLRSFKFDTEENFSEVKEKIDDLYDTDRGYDLRLSRLERKAIRNNG